MSGTAEARRVREILASVKPLAAEYYRLTGKPLGVTGEVAEYIAAETLQLQLAPPRTHGYDAIRKTTDGEQRIQIKGRAYGEDAKPGQRLGTIKRGAPCDSVLLVLLDNRTLEHGKCGKPRWPPSKRAWLFQDQRHGSGVRWVFQNSKGS